LLLRRRPAGRDAAWRALETALPYMTDGRQLRFMFLPDGEDPDTLVRKEGKAAFEARMEQAQPLSTFLFNSLPQVDLSTDGRAQLSTLALPLITQVPGETLRIYLRQELGNKLGILDDSQLERLMPKQAENVHPRPAPQLKRTTMRILIGLLVQNPDLAPLVPPLAGWTTKNARTWLIFRTGQHLFVSARSDHRATFRAYRGTKRPQPLKNCRCGTI
jgi:DNA primase